MFNVDSSEGLKFLTRIRLGLSQVADHKFIHNFQDCVNLVCSCGQEIETSTHFLLHCFNYNRARQTLFEKVKKIDSSILKQRDQNKNFALRRSKTKSCPKQIHTDVYI